MILINDGEKSVPVPANVFLLILLTNLPPELTNRVITQAVEAMKSGKITLPTIAVSRLVAPTNTRPS